MRQKLTQDAPGLEDKVVLWREDPVFQEGADRVANAVQQNDRWDAVYDSPQLSEFALLAYSDNKISLAQFCSITFQWNCAVDFRDDIEEIEHHKISALGCTATELLRPFLPLLVGDSFNDGINVPIPQADFDKYLNSLLLENVPESERSFSLLRLREGAKMPALYQALRRVNFGLFLPIIDDDNYVVIIPSFTMIENILKVLGDAPIQLIPAIGDTSGQGVVDFHDKHAHPLGLSFPGYEHTEADGFESKMWLFVTHDLYHPVLINFVKVLELTNYYARFAMNYLDEMKIPETSILHDRAGVLIDAEVGRYYLQAVFNKYNLAQYMRDQVNGGVFYKESAFSEILSRVLIPKLEGLEDEKQDDPEGQIEFVERVMTDFIKQRESWHQKGIDIARCLLGCSKHSFVDENTNPRKKFSANPSETTSMDAETKGFKKLEEITQGILREGRAHHLLDESSKNWLKLISETEKQLFQCINTDDAEQFAQCLDLRKSQNLPINIDAKDSSHCTLLLSATAKKNLTMVAMLLEHGADPNQVSGEEQTLNVSKNGTITLGLRPLHIAARENNVSLLEILLKHGANLGAYNTDKKTPIDITMEFGYVDAFQFLIQRSELAESHLEYCRAKGAIHNTIEPFILKYRKNNDHFLDLLNNSDSKEVEAFLEANPEWTPETRLVETTHFNCENPFLLVPEDHQLTTPFAVVLKRKDNNELFKVLIQRSSEKQTLNRDIFYGLQIESVRSFSWTESTATKLTLWLENGLLINQYYPYKMGTFNAGEVTTVWGMLRDIPISKGFFAVDTTDSLFMPTNLRKICINHGADVNEPNRFGRPELITAALINDTDYAEFLLSKGARVNALDRSSTQLGNALHVACGCGNKKLVALLVNHGANWTLKNKAGLTPQQLAIMNGHKELLSEFFPVSLNPQSDASTPEDASSDTTSVQVMADLSHKMSASNSVDLSKLEIFSLHPEIKKRLRLERSNPSFELGKSTLSGQVKSDKPDFSHPIFSDEKLWHYALDLFNKGTISPRQFTTLSIRCTYLKHFANKIDSVEHFSLRSQAQYTKNTLRRFLHLTDKKARAIFETLESSGETEIEMTFSLIKLKENAFVNGLMSDLYRITRIPLLPIQESNRVLVLIPSLTLMESILTGLFENSLKLRPVLGRLNFEGHLECMKEGCLPLELSPSTESDLESLFSSFAKAFTLSANENNSMLFKITEIIHSLSAAHPNLETLGFFKSFSEVRGISLIQYNKTLVEEGLALGTPPSDEALFMSALLSDFSEPDEHNNNPRCEGRDAFLDALLQEMITQREKWQRDYHFSVGQFLDQLSSAKNVNLEQSVRRKADDQIGRQYANYFSLMGEIPIASINSNRHKNQSVEADVRAQKKLLEKVLQFCASSVLEKSDSEWAFNALTLREHLLAIMTKNDPKMIDTIKHLHNEWNFDFSATLPDGTNALDKACSMGNTEVVSLLCDYGLNPNLSTDQKPSKQKSKEIDFATRAVHIAATNNNAKMLSTLLEKGASLEVYNDEKLSPLSIGLIKGHVQIVILCLKRVEINQAYLRWLRMNHSIHSDCEAILERYFSFRHALSTLLDNRYTSVNEIRTLLDNNPEQNINCYVPFLVDNQREENTEEFQHCALGRNLVPCLHKVLSIEHLQILLEMGVNINAVDPNGNTAVMRLLMSCDPKSEHNFFSRSVTRDHLNTARFLIERGANLLQENATNKSALSLSVKAKKLEIAQLILEKIALADPKIKKSILSKAVLQVLTNVRIDKGWDESSVKFFKLFLKEGVDFSTRIIQDSLFSSLLQKPATQSLWQYLRSMQSTGSDDKQEPIELPLGLRIFCIIQGADIDEPTLDGKTEVFYAISLGHDDYLAFLLKRNASLKVLTPVNLTPTQYATKLENEKCLSILQDYDQPAPSGFGFFIKSRKFSDKTLSEAIHFHEIELEIGLKEKTLEEFLVGEHKEMFLHFNVWADWTQHRVAVKDNPKPFYDPTQLQNLKARISSSYNRGEGSVRMDYPSAVEHLEQLILAYNTLANNKTYRDQKLKRNTTADSFLQQILGGSLSGLKK